MRDPVTPRGRYEAVGTEGRLAAIVSGVLAVVVMLGVIAAIFLFLIKATENAQEPAADAAGKTHAGPAAAAKGPQEAAAMADCPNCPIMVTIPPGMFLMGVHAEEADADNVPAMQRQAEQPLHGVTVRDPIALGQTEVTRGQFAVFVAETNHQSLGCMVNDGRSWIIDRTKSWRDPGFSQDDQHPVVCVNYEDAEAYTAWLTRKTSKRYRLPTETEWEYAARAGAANGKPWGEIPALACAHGKVADRSHAARFSRKTALMFFPCETGYAFTAPVAHYQANGFGLFDVYGNVREVVADCWNPNYWGKGIGTKAQRSGASDTAVLRGGGWYDAPSNIRPARRFRADRSLRRADQGFRVAKDLPVTVN
ncbi:SUMF1/EgtB/PvdO family nonheme iron enzyme [Emcibacter sp. SYSU 3D8]|uniref:formylglycine-generating enzyme family protein n=1 Tax=Emcibacter sp. SYSU 3D8 TaxID=3133969 RepID=UPI0031FE6FAD